MSGPVFCVTQLLGGATMSTDDKKSKKKDKRKSGGEDDLATKGLPSTEFLIKPETSAPKIDTSK